jgi:hypothetical protein
LLNAYFDLVNGSIRKIFETAWPLYNDQPRLINAEPKSVLASLQKIKADASSVAPQIDALVRKSELYPDIRNGLDWNFQSSLAESVNGIIPMLEGSVSAGTSVHIDSKVTDKLRDGINNFRQWIEKTKEAIVKLRAEDDAAEILAPDTSTQKREEPTLKSPTPVVLPNYDDTERADVRAALRSARGIFDKSFIPARQTIQEVVQTWEGLLRLKGAAEISNRLKPPRDTIRNAAKEVDQLLYAYRDYDADLRGVLFKDAVNPAHAIDSALSMLIDDLDELAKGQSIDAVRWSRPRFQELGELQAKFDQWVGRADSLITKRNIELREGQR